MCKDIPLHGLELQRTKYHWHMTPIAAKCKNIYIRSIILYFKMAMELINFSLASERHAFS